MTEPEREDRLDYLEAMAKRLQDPDAYLRFLETKLDREAAPLEAVPYESGVRPIVPPED